MAEHNQIIKEDYWQFLRGVAIIFVVLSHCISVIELDDLRSCSPLGIWHCLEVNLISTAVAIFFFISGYWATKSYQRHPNASYFCIRRCKRLLIPYLVYTILYIVFRFILRESFSPNKLIGIFILGKAATPLYYLPVLLLFSLLTPFFLQLQKRGLLIIPSSILALLFLAVRI